MDPRLGAYRVDGGLASMVALLLLLLGGRPALVRAQDEPSPEQKRAAAEAYDRGASAWLAGRYARAARFFEAAYRIVPSAPALIQAVRAHERAGNALRAATLALLLEERYPDDARAAAVAERVLRAHADEFTRVEVDCDDCALEVDGAIVEQHAFFVEPGKEHVVVAGFETGAVRKTVRGEPGQTVRLSFEAPEPPPPRAEGRQDGEEGAGTEVARSSRASAIAEGEPLLPLWVPISLGAATLAVAGVTVWSGIDTLAARDEYVARPTREGYERGVELERRTNILLGTSVALGVATAVTSVLALTRGEPVERPEGAATVRPGFRYVRGGGMATLRVRW